MAGDSKKLQPIIVKKIKRGGHAHHGGAWKIAYADFVTAMMAFFLLMWLLGSTTEGDKKGIADYFSSPLKIALLIPLLAALLGLFNGFRMTRLPDPKPSAAGESVLGG